MIFEAEWSILLWMRRCRAVQGNVAAPGGETGAGFGGKTKKKERGV